ncbi:MAG: hypothetical protein R3F14_20575 [Polyangiaceae bacterium]
MLGDDEHPPISETEPLSDPEPEPDPPVLDEKWDPIAIYLDFDMDDDSPPVQLS